MRMPVGSYIDTYSTRMSPYNQRFLFVTSPEDFEEILVELDRRGKTDRWAKFKGRFSRAGGLCCGTGQGLTLVCANFDQKLTFNFMMSQKFIYVMCHEIQHCLLNTAKRVGYNPMNEHEPHTYMTNWMMECLFGFMRDYHYVVFTHVNAVHNLQLHKLHRTQAIDALSLVPPHHVRDALAREARALINNEVKVTYAGARSVTYFE